MFSSTPPSAIMLLMQILQILLVLLLGTGLAFSAIRLMWIAGSYLKRRTHHLQ